MTHPNNVGLRFTRTFRLATAVALFGPPLLGCSEKLYDEPTYSQSNYEAARILLSQRTLVAWDDIKDQLSPNFGSLTGPSALAQVLPTSQTATDQLITTLGVALRAGLPSSGETLTKTTDLATGAVTGTDTVTKSPGVAPTTTATLPSTTLNTLTGVPDDLKKIADDPFLKYQLAAGLIQQVALLDNELKKIELASDKKAFLLGLNLDVQPFKREQPYDVFVDISLYPYQQIFPTDNAPAAVQANGTKSPTIDAVAPIRLSNTALDQTEDPCNVAQLPEVMPLVEMDNLEATVHSNTIESVTQLALALQATMQGVGAALDTTYKRDLIRSLLGKDRNSLFTMGKSSVNTLAIRIGALNQVKVERELQAQSHRIYSLVLIPNSYLKCKEAALHVVAQSTLNDSKTGKKLESITEAQYRGYIADALSHYGWDLTPEINGYVEPLSMAVAARDFDRFMVVLEQAAVAFKVQVPNYAYAETVPDDVKTKRYIHYLADTLWQDLQRVDSSYGLVYEKVVLPTAAPNKTAPDKVPPQQTIIAEDNGKLTQLTLRGTKIVGPYTEVPGDPDKTLLIASLLVQPTGQLKPDVYLPLENAKSDGNSLTFTFPSMRELELSKQILAGAPVSLKIDGQVPAGKGADGNEVKGSGSKWSQTYLVRFKPSVDDEPPAKFDLAQSASVIVADPATGSGVARLNLSIEGNARVKVAVRGADWDDQAGDGSLFTESQTIFVRLSNLVEGTSVTVTATVQDSRGKLLATKALQFGVKNGQRQTP